MTILGNSVRTRGMSIAILARTFVSMVRATLREIHSDGLVFPRVSNKTVSVLLDRKQIAFSVKVERSRCGSKGQPIRRRAARQPSDLRRPHPRLRHRSTIRSQHLVRNRADQRTRSEPLTTPYRDAVFSCCLAVVASVCPASNAR